MNSLRSYFVGALVCLFAFGCQNRPETSSEAESQKVAYDGPAVKNDWAVYWLPASPQILNPILSTDAYANPILGNVFDTLIYYNPQTGEPIGRLAERWEVSDDGLKYDFFLRKEIKFHDGKELTAEDVKFSYERLKDPKVIAPHIQNYFKDFQKIEVLGSHHVRMHMTTPYFRNLIILGLAEIMPAHIYGQGDFNTLDANRAPVGSGPYKFSKWDQGRLIELERNENYWGRNVEAFSERFNFNKILYRIITEDSVAALALKKGEIDALTPTLSQYLRDFKGEDFESKFHRLKYSTPDGSGYGYIGWNLQKERFQDKRVRRALAHAMPRQEINERLYEGIRVLSVGPIPQGSPKISSSIQPLQYDLLKAKELLKEAGYSQASPEAPLLKAGENLNFELMFTAQSPENERIALIYQQSLKQLGIEMTIRTLEWTVFLKNVKDGNFDAAMLAWGSSLDSDPYQVWHSSQAKPGASNFIHYKNPRVDELLEIARVTLDREKRNQMYREFSEIIADEAPYLFLFERPGLFIVTRRFENALPVGVLGPDSDAYFTAPGNEKYKTQAQAN